MLKHEDTSYTPPKSAAQVRVTPEELAAAVTALQIRKEGQPGTIAIGDAVEELGLDVTPEEVLAEVQARRQTIPRKRRSKLWDRLVVALGVSGILLWCSFFVVDYSSGSPSYNEQTVPTASYSSTFSVTPPPVHLTCSPSLVVADASGKLVMLSEVGDNQPVTCALNGNSLEQATGMEPNRWTLIKHDGKVYLRGWMARTSTSVLEKDGADVSASQNSISVPVTLLISGFNFSETPQDFPGRDFHAADIHLDKYAYEKW